MGAPEDVNPPQSRDSWDKADIIFKPVGALLTALTIAFVSFFATRHLDANRDQDARTRLYTELMSKREDSESSLRKDMFSAVIGTILKDTVSLDEKILQLEMLAYNFHESLNLMPLFEYLDRHNNQSNKSDSVREENRSRLIKMSKAVINKQVSTLEGVGESALFIYCDSVGKKITKAYTGTKGSYTFFDSVKVDNVYKRVKHDVYLDVVNFDTKSSTVKINLKVNSFKLEWSKEKPHDKFDSQNPEFRVSYYEFPMIDNTRLFNDKRLAVTLSCFDNDCEKEIAPPADGCDTTVCEALGYFHRIEFKVLYFPGTHSSLKEKPYFNDIMKKLLPSESD